MEWLPSVLLVVIGLVLLAVVVLALLRHLRRTRFASERLLVSVTGRTSRLKAGVAEIHAWRDARGRVRRTGPDTRDA